MRFQFPLAMIVPFLLCACGGGTGNEAGDTAGRDGSVTVPMTDGNEAAPPDGSPAEGQPGPAGEISLKVSPERTTEDSTVTLALRNGSDQQLGYNLCTSTLQTESGREVPTSRMCTMEIRTLEPGRTDTYRYTLPVNMAEGSYRFVTRISPMGSGRTRPVRSNAFTVRAD